MYIRLSDSRVVVTAVVQSVLENHSFGKDADALINARIKFKLLIVIFAIDFCKIQ